MIIMAKRLDETAKGVYIIATTPFTERGEIDWPGMDGLIEFYLEHGVSGMTILGIMGEAHKLSESESAELTRHILKRVDGRIPVIVGVSNPGTANLAKLSRLAMDAGACGVMVAPLNGLKTEEQILGYFKGVIGELGPDIPVVYQDYPQTTNVHISAECFAKLVDAHPSLVMLKHEDSPGLKKLTQVRKLCDGTKRRRVSILCGNGGLYLAQEMRRGADGAMTGFAFPEMLVGVCRLFEEGKPEAAEDLYDAYLPLVRHEQQPGIGLAIRKEVLRRRGIIKSAALRAPGPKLDADDLKELDELMVRLERRLAGEGRGAKRAAAE
jgi:4-hydroxy-tetrahydrodipicolinate synthase